MYLHNKDHTIYSNWRELKRSENWRTETERVGRVMRVARLLPMRTWCQIFYLIEDIAEWVNEKPQRWMNLNFYRMQRVLLFSTYHMLWISCSGTAGSVVDVSVNWGGVHRKRSGLSILTDILICWVSLQEMIGYHSHQILFPRKGYFEVENAQNSPERQKRTLLLGEFLKKQKQSS